MLNKTALLALITSSAFAMHTAEININDHDLELSGRLDMGQFNDTTQPDTLFLGARFLHGDDSHSDLKNSSIHNFYELNFLMQRAVLNSDLSIGLGVKINHTDNFTTVPLGIEAQYKLPLENIIPMYVGGAFYYAPEVLSMEDAQDFLEYRINLDIEVIDNTNFDTNKLGDTNYNSSVYAGFKFAF